MDNQLAADIPDAEWHALSFEEQTALLRGDGSLPGQHEEHFEINTPERLEWYARKVVEMEASRDRAILAYKTIVDTRSRTVTRFKARFETEAAAFAKKYIVDEKNGTTPKSLVTPDATIKLTQCKAGKYSLSATDSELRSWATQNQLYTLILEKTHEVFDESTFKSCLTTLEDGRTVYRVRDPYRVRDITFDVAFASYTPPGAYTMSTAAHKPKE
jgi:hypothetical protein